MASRSRESRKQPERASPAVRRCRDASPRRRAGAARLLTDGRAVLLASVALALVAGCGAGTRTHARTLAISCNGSPSLCGRRIDQVVFPATHNSMSAASEGFRFANQETGIRAQLEGGIRGLLIDTHPGVATPKGVYTVLRPDAKSQEKLEAAIGSAATAVAKGIRAGLGYRGGGKSELYLCHGYCEIGASRAIDQFAAIRDFLQAHRDAVLLVSVEDDATPREFSEAVADSGLLALVWKGTGRAAAHARRDGGGRSTRAVHGRERPWGRRLASPAVRDRPGDPLRLQARR